MKTLAAIALICLASCAPKIVVSPLAPRAVVVSETTRATSNQAIKVKKNTEKLDEGIRGVQTDIVKGRNLARHMAQNGNATPQQLKQNAAAWEAVSIKNLFLEAAAQNAMIDATDLQVMADRAAAESATLRVEAEKADATALALQSELAKQSVDAARGKAVKHGIWLLLGIGILYLAIRFLLPLLKPL
jgi:hypothetical protein